MCIRTLFAGGDYPPVFYWLASFLLTGKGY